MQIPQENKRSTAASGLIIMLSLLAVLWVLTFIDEISYGSLIQFGIKPRTLNGLVEILIAPFLHVSWCHLITNSAPFAILGFLAFLSGIRNWISATLWAMFLSGIFIWLFSPTNSVTVGASGVIFGWLSYLLARGFYTKKFTQILVSLLVLMVYGSVLWGILPGEDGLSWQGHLGGVIGGLIAARLNHHKSDATQQ